MGNFLDQTGLKTLLGLIKTKTTTLIQNYAADNLPVLSNGIIPAKYIPGYVDDVMEFKGIANILANSGKLTSGKPSTQDKGHEHIVLAQYHYDNGSGYVYRFFWTDDNATYYTSWEEDGTVPPPSSFGTVGTQYGGVIPATGKIYFDTANNKTYRWSGSEMIDISSQEVGTTNFALTTLGVASWKENGTAKSATLAEATTTAHGLMSASDKAKLNGIAAGANNYTYTLPAATSSALGGIKTGYTTSGKNYKVQLDSSNNAYVNVPWTDNNTTYSALTTDEITAAVTAAWT